MLKSKEIHASSDFMMKSVIISEDLGGPVAEPVARLVMHFPRARELPRPVELRRVDYAVTRNSFRGFGINE